MLPQFWFRKKRVFGIGTDLLVNSLTVSLVMWKRKGSLKKKKKEFVGIKQYDWPRCSGLEFWSPVFYSYGFILN